MSKQIRTDDLRAIHRGVCFAIDLVFYVEGTSNKRPAFSPGEVATLENVLHLIQID